MTEILFSNTPAHPTDPPPTVVENKRLSLAEKQADPARRIIVNLWMRYKLAKRMSAEAERTYPLARDLQVGLAATLVEARNSFHAARSIYYYGHP